MAGLQIIGMIVFIIGILFMIAEIFLPSFGVSGGVGFLAMTLGIIMTAKSFAQGMLYFVIMLFASVVFLIVGYHLIGNSRIALKNNLREDSTPNYHLLIGEKGRALTPLRPSGTVEIKETRFDVLTRGEFINTNEVVQVVAVENNHIIVGRM